MTTEEAMNEHAIEWTVDDKVAALVIGGGIVLTRVKAREEGVEVRLYTEKRKHHETFIPWEVLVDLVANLKKKTAEVPAKAPAPTTA